MPRKNHTDARLVRARLTYMLELARGSSHIASTRQRDTRERAIAEVLQGFGEHHGQQLLAVFRELLAQATEQRGDREAAAAVRDFGLPPAGTRKQKARQAVT